ncbi:unnamed protein product [Amoebophrya sp. A120]|nr:unnamed protein product [Amoebophrya sp. A120]|eukprot:GSA120T00009662001.1
MSSGGYFCGSAGFFFHFFNISMFFYNSSSLLRLSPTQVRSFENNLGHNASFHSGTPMISYAYLLFRAAQWQLFLLSPHKSFVEQVVISFLLRSTDLLYVVYRSLHCGPIFFSK